MLENFLSNHVPMRPVPFRQCCSRCSPLTYAETVLAMANVDAANTLYFDEIEPLAMCPLQFVTTSNQHNERIWGMRMR